MVLRDKPHGRADPANRKYGFTLAACARGANPNTLWPPNGKSVPVTVSGVINDTSSGVNASTAAYSVTDEYGEIQPSGPITLAPLRRYIAGIRSSYENCAVQI